jgi:stage II sporulation protein D
MPHRRAHILAASAAALALGSATALAATSHGTSAPPPESEVTIFTFKGRGWGHGVGMSQWGARGRALAGWSAPRILRYYYRSTRIQRGPRGAVRVLLATSRRKLVVSSPAAWQVVDEGRRPRRALSLPKRRRYTFVRSGNRISLIGDGRRLATMTGSVRLQPRVAGSHLRVIGPGLGVGGHRYRGVLRLHRGTRGLDIVNRLNLERYLYGVVPSEVPHEWDRDARAAVQAQAIAARTYALATRKDRGIFDMYADTRSQVYGGLDAEERATNRAVDRTRRMVVTHGGRPITALFFSTSGGRTEHNENVFSGSPSPYLRSVPDRYDRVSPLHRWTDPPSFTAADLGDRLGLGEPVQQIVVTRRGRSPRVRTAVAVTASGRRAFTGPKLRAMLELRDTWFTPVRRRVSATQAESLTS